MALVFEGVDWFGRVIESVRFEPRTGRKQISPSMAAINRQLRWKGSYVL